MPFIETRKKLLDGKPIAVVSGNHNADMVEYLGQFGVDGVWIECEHGPVDWDEIGDFSRACDLWSMASIVRVSAAEPWLITRTLDRGASGLVIPHVSTGETARVVGEASRFGPLGLRGMFGGRRAYGVKEYYERANEEVLLTVLIEEAEAVKNLDDILKERRIDVFFVAPSDLAQTMGYTGNHGHPEVQKVIDDSLRKIVKAGRVAGTLTNDENLGRYLDMGVQFTLTSWMAWIGEGITRYRDAVAAKR